MKVAVVPALLATLLCSGCSAGGEGASQAYTLTAFEAAGVQPNSDQPLVPEARKILPLLLSKCGISNHEQVDATDSAIVVRFELIDGQTEILECIRKAMPVGADLRETIVPKNA